MVARVFGTMASDPSRTRVEAIVLRTVGPQGSLFELLLPAGMRVLSGELAEIDVLLDDERFFKPFRRFFDPVEGRPSIPIETYLRLMFLKYRYRLGFEPLCREVADSISWQRFARIPLGVAVPHPTTLMKITTRCGANAVDGLNEALLAKAAAAKVLKTNKVRADTTVVEANVAYPTDSGLLAKGVAGQDDPAAQGDRVGVADQDSRPDSHGPCTGPVDRCEPAAPH
jgi:IS5 family transposase